LALLLAVLLPQLLIYISCGFWSVQSWWVQSRLPLGCHVNSNSIPALAPQVIYYRVDPLTTVGGLNYVNRMVGSTARGDRRIVTSV
jgi:hypothetical protein